MASQILLRPSESAPGVSRWAEEGSRDQTVSLTRGSTSPVPIAKSFPGGSMCQVSVWSVFLSLINKPGETLAKGSAFADYMSGGARPPGVGTRPVLQQQLLFDDDDDGNDNKQPL